MPDPWADPDNAPDLNLLERRLEARIELPYYRRALDCALSLFEVTPRLVVDLGCGTGATSRWLAGRLGPGSMVVGIDRSRRLIERAIELAADSDLSEQVQFAVADGVATGRSGNDADLVFAATVLEHTSDPGAMVAEMARLCRPAGQVIVLAQDYETLILNNPDQETALTRRLLNAFVDGFAYPWAGRAVGGWLRAAGLSDVRVATSASVETEAAPAFLDYLGQMMRTLAVQSGRVPAADLERWLDGLRAANEGGAFFINWSFFCWSARKPPA